MNVKKATARIWYALKSKQEPLVRALLIGCAALGGSVQATEQVWQKNDGALSASTIISVKPKELNSMQTHLLCNVLVKEQVYLWAQALQMVSDFERYTDNPSEYKSVYYDQDQLNILSQIVRRLLDEESLKKQNLQEVQKQMKQQIEHAMWLWLLMDEMARKRPFGDIDVTIYDQFPMGGQLDAVILDGVVRKARQRNGYEYMSGVSNSCLGAWGAWHKEWIEKSAHMQQWRKKLESTDQNAVARQRRDALIHGYDERYKKHAALKAERFSDDVFHTLMYVLDPKKLDELSEKQKK